MNTTTKTNELVFQNSPTVHFGGSEFHNVPIILRVNKVPLVQVTRAIDASFTSAFRLYNKDGVKIAAVVGTQMYLTNDGKKSNLKLRHPDHRTVCELDDQILFEIEREGAAAIKAQAELYTPEGSFLRCSEGSEAYISARSKQEIQAGKMTIKNCALHDFSVGIDIDSEGGTTLGLVDATIKYDALDEFLGRDRWTKGRK